MLPVPGKVERKESNLLACYRHMEHLWIRVEMSSLNRGKPQNKPRHRIVAKQISATTNFKIRSSTWPRIPKRKSFVVSIRKPMLESFEAHSKARTPVGKIAKLTKITVGSLRRKALRLGIGLVTSAN